MWLKNRDYTNLDYELSGRTHYDDEPTSWITIILVTLGVLMAAIALYDLFIGIDVEALIN